MTEQQITAALARRRKQRRIPWSQNQIAKLKGCSRSLISQAVKHPARQPGTRHYIEALLRRRARA